MIPRLRVQSTLPENLSGSKGEKYADRIYT
jgi:hypothetical protein